MTREEIHTEIGNIIKLIEINNNRMFLNDADFELDAELLRSHIVRLYGLYDQLTLTTSTSSAEFEKPEVKVIQAAPKTRVKKVIIEQPVEEPEEEVQEEVEEVIEEVEPEIVEEVPAPVVEEIPEPEVEESPKVEPVAKKQEVKSQSKKPRPSVTADDLYGRLKNTKLDSIKKGISISKRYEIQNELFDNNPETYNNAIKTLDNQSSFDDAMEYLEGTLMTQHGWKEDDVLVDEIRILLYRRYS
jgi:hypothetical protein